MRIGFGGTWMYWDAEIRAWRLVGVKTVDPEPWADLPDNEPSAICRPCSETGHAECEGALVCKCPCRDELSIEFLVHELEREWDERDRDKQRLGEK